jgi:hypothetical protein
LDQDIRSAALNGFTPVRTDNTTPVLRPSGLEQYIVGGSGAKVEPATVLSPAAQRAVAKAKASGITNAKQLMQIAKDNQ